MKYLILIIILIFFNNYTYAISLFETSSHNIEFVSKDIDRDKIKEINRIKKISILNIFKKTLDDENFSQANNYLSEDLINTFIKNIIINDEKIINENYSSKIKINFTKKKIIEFYRNKNISYVEYNPDKFLFIIYDEDEIAENLFSKNNIYYKYLNDDLNNNKLFKIPNLDINDRFILKKEDISKRDFKRIKNFSYKYNLNEIVVVHRKKNNNNFNLILYSEEEIYEKKLYIKGNKLSEFFKILEFEIINIWKKVNQIQNNSINFMNCKINYFNMLELKEIRNNFYNISLIKDLSIKSLGYKNIYYDIYYYGNLKILFKVFELNNLKININENECVIKLK